ncbi:MAG TPA: pyridoxamine 5'-phosphate oxidase family protein [Dehalococcoidia bacterium]|nr:pyridoxamine 5'-phosphate oxidase family protein [Dehalococcoidia bacterium]
MTVTLRDEIVTYMEKCRACTIATANTDGQPSASTVFFKNSGTDIYFNTARDAEKVKNILVNPRVAIAIEERVPIPNEDKGIKGIQYIGKAEILADKNITEVPKAVMARHNAFNSVKAGNSVIVKVTPLKIYLIDYSRGFRHRELLEF